MRDTADASIKQANASIAAIEISRAQIRAAFSCKFRMKIGSDQKQTLEYNCKNTGQSQARKVSINFIFGYWSDRGLTNLAHDVFTFLEVVAQGDPIEQTATSVDAIPDAVLKNSWAHNMRCIIKFTDIFGDQQTQTIEEWRPVDRTKADQFTDLVARPN